MVSFIKRSQRSQLDLDSVLHKKVTIRSRYGVVDKRSQLDLDMVSFIKRSQLDLDMVSFIKRSQ